MCISPVQDICGHHRWPALLHPSPLCFCKHKRLAFRLSIPVSLLLPRPHWLTSERARGKRDGIHQDRLFMLTTGWRITPLRNEDRYALVFCLPPSSYFLLPLCQLLLFFFFIFPSLWCVPAIMCMYVCTCATQIAVDGFNQMAAPFCSIYFFFLPFFGKAPSGICVAPTREMGHKSALFVRNVALKGKKKNRPTQRRIFQRDSRQARCSALAHIPASLLCRPLFFYVLYLKKVYSDKQEKKGLQMQN